MTTETPPEPSPEQKVLGRILRAARRSRGMSQAQVAKIIRSNQAYVSLAERGLQNPPFLTLQRFAKAFGKRFTYDFIDDTGDDL